MASVFSYYAGCFYYSSNRDDQLTQSPRVSNCFHFPHHIPDSRLTVELIRLLIATIVPPLICNASHPFMEPKRMTSTCP